MVMCNVRGVIHSDEATENYHSTLHLFLALWLFMVSFSSLFSCQFSTVLFWFILIMSFSDTAGSCFQRKSSKDPLYATCSAPNSKKTKVIRIAGEHSGAFSSLRARYIPQELIEANNKANTYWITRLRWPKTWLQMNDNCDNRHLNLIHYWL